MAVLSSRAQERRNSREARENERRSREKNKKVASAPIFSRFLCPRPLLLLSAPNQNRHATQANFFFEKQPNVQNKTKKEQ